MNDLGLIRLFVQVADMGSFSAVARATGTTPSAVSRQMSRLEEDLGTRLLQRTTRQQVLTEAGETYLHHARQIVEDVDAAQRAVTQRGTTPSGVLRVTAETDLANTLIAPHLPDFLNKYPDLQVQLHTSATIEDLVGRGLDLAIRFGHLEDSSLMARRLTLSPSVLVASPAYLDSHKTPQHPTELTDLSCLSYRLGAPQTTWRFTAEGAPLKVSVTGRLQASSVMFLREAAVAGLGIAMLPIWMVRQDLKNQTLMPVLPDFPLDPPTTPISAVYPSGRNLAAKVRVFIDHLSSQLENTSPLR